jgi:hypothetical protein
MGRQAGRQPEARARGDETAPPSHADLYGRAIPQAQVRLLPGRDHQLNNDLREVAEAIRPGKP